MYKIIGTDQKEYGPVSSDQIKTWIAQGRVHAQTKAQADGGEWKTLSDFPEFAAIFGNPAPPTPPSASAPPLPSSITSPVPPSPKRTSGLAIASLILGILGIFPCGLTALIGLILGIVAMSQVRKSNGTLGGHGLALAGTIVSAVLLLFGVLIGTAMLLPALAKAKAKAMSIQCMNNARELSSAAHVYAGDHQNHFPAATNWCDALKSYVTSEKTFKCPAANALDRCDYGFNSRLDGVDMTQVNSNTVLFFETEDGWDVSGGPELLLTQSRHAHLIVVAFADGHVEVIAPLRLSSLRWNP